MAGLHRWQRSIEVTVAFFTAVAAGLTAVTWVVVASIPDFAAAADHPNYVSPLATVLIFGAIAFVFGGLAGLIDALLFLCLRIVAAKAGLGGWATYASGAIASVVSVTAVYLALGRGAGGPGPIGFIGILSAISVAGFVAWIRATRRIDRIRERMSPTNTSSGDLDDLF